MTDFTQEPFVNPYQMVYDQIRKTFREDPRFTGLVTLKNQIDFGTGDNRDPVKRQPDSADFPEMMLRSTGVTGINLMNTSSSTMITRQYDWVLTSGDFRFQIVHALEWVVTTCTLRWPLVDQLTSLEWKGERFVKVVRLTDANIGLTADNLKLLQIRGWMSVWSMSVEMHFQTSNLRENTPLGPDA